MNENFQFQIWIDIESLQIILLCGVEADWNLDPGKYRSLQNTCQDEQLCCGFLYGSDCQCQGYGTETGNWKAMCRPHLMSWEEGLLFRQESGDLKRLRAQLLWGNVWWPDGFVQTILNMSFLCWRFCAKVKTHESLCGLVQVWHLVENTILLEKGGCFFSQGSSKVAGRYERQWCKNNARGDVERKDAYAQNDDDDVAKAGQLA